MKFQWLIMLTSLMSAAQEMTDSVNSSKDVKEILYSINNILNFIERFYYQMNIDGLLGITLAQAQLEQIIFNARETDFQEVIVELINKCEHLHAKITSTLPKASPRYDLFAKYLLKPYFWYNKVYFGKNHLLDLGIYQNWTEEFIVSQRQAAYQGISTDICLEEVLKQNEKTSEYKECPVSSLCQAVVLGDRNDTGYLLTHRLFYLQIARQSKCIMGAAAMQQYIRHYCSQIWKESKTNEYLNFPQHDIFMEQVVFCGMEGYEDFLIPRWRNKVIGWQTMHGCYSDGTSSKYRRRNMNIIEFGCTDHTTGLGAAALAINLRYLLTTHEEN